MIPLKLTKSTPLKNDVAPPAVVSDSHPETYTK